MQQSTVVVFFMNNSNMNLTSLAALFYDVAFYFYETQKSQNTSNNNNINSKNKIPLINELIKKTVNGGAYNIVIPIRIK